MKATVPLTSDHYQGPRKRSLLAAVNPVRVALLTDEEADKLRELDAREGAPFEVPRWLAKQVLKRKWRFKNDGDRLTTCLALLYPKGRIPSRGDIAFHAEQACSITGPVDGQEAIPDVIRRAADAAEDLFRRGYTISEETILTTRAALAQRDARRKQETTDDA